MNKTYLFSSLDRNGVTRLYSVTAESYYLALIDLISMMERPMLEMNGIWYYRDIDSDPVASSYSWDELCKLHD